MLYNSNKKTKQLTKPLCRLYISNHVYIHHKKQHKNHKSKSHFIFNMKLQKFNLHSPTFLSNYIHYRKITLTAEENWKKKLLKSLKEFFTIDLVSSPRGNIFFFFVLLFFLYYYFDAKEQQFKKGFKLQKKKKIYKRN